MTLDVQVPHSSNEMAIQCAGLHLVSTWVPPITHPENVDADKWVFRNSDEETLRLAGGDGALTRQLFTAIGLELTREVWRSGDAIGIRNKLRNVGAESVRLNALVPLQCDPNKLMVDGLDAGHWRVLAHKRLKNGIPSSFQPGILDEDFKHVSRGMTEMGGVQDGVGRVEQVEMDPCCLIQGNETILLIGFLSQRGHCARILMQVATRDSETQLQTLKAECEFDGVLLPPGGERTSQWIFIKTGHDANALLDDFADRVGIYHGVDRPTEHPPSVFCSWQFYGESFNEKDFHEDLAHLEKERIPFDVFLIDDCWTIRGDYDVNEEWPHGMQDAARRIAALGYRPGIWNCPFIARIESKMAKDRPEWLLRLKDGSPHLFYVNGPNYVLDPTYPGVCDFWEDTFRRMTHDWGFTYHKLDFLRSVFLDPNVKFYNPAATRLEAYQMGLEAIRRGAGPDAYISVCGGHYGASLGLADSQPSGSDVASNWHEPPALPKFKQNILRTWMSRLWHVDPDAMMVRRREKVYRETGHGFLSLGKFSDVEAQTIAVNQYVGGGMVCLCEKFSELDGDRKALYRHVIPSIQSPGISLDPFEKVCPSHILTRVHPLCTSLDPWVTLCVINWLDEPRRMSVALEKAVTASLKGDQFLVSEFFSQTVLGIFDKGATIDLGKCDPHTSQVVRITPWDGQTPTLAGTDMHFSGGGVELVEWETNDRGIQGKVETRWAHPIRITVALPKDEGFDLRTISVSAEDRHFHIEI
jgi:hypothetical protein